MDRSVIHSRDDETIIALSTPRGPGAIALIRLSGINVFAIVTAISKLIGNKAITAVPTHTVHVGWVVNHIQQPIDQVMFTVLHAPSTFTGQDCVEITAHNNQFIIEAIVEAAIQQGARLAHEGEFTKRAFLNGKIDLIQAEAINELIHAQTTIALKKSLAQLKGSFSSWIIDIEQELITILAWTEASFEFLDEETEFGEQIKQRLYNIIDKIVFIKKNFSIQQQLRQGIRIALIGSVNAGKSSIFNALLGHKRSIVTAIAGTTRDSIEAGMCRNENFWTLIDTAGLRTTDDVIEQEGIQRSYEEAQKADIILLIIDGSRPLTTQEYTTYQHLFNTYEAKTICLQNKTDLPQKIAHNITGMKPLFVTSQEISTCSIIEKAIESKVNELFTTVESPFLLNQRHYNLLIGLEKQLVQTLSLVQGTTVPYELVAYHVRDAIEHISELTGKSVTEAGIDKVFKEFCVGK